MGNKKKYIIWGSAGHAKVLTEIVEQQDGYVAALFDNNPDSKSISADISLFIGEDGFKEWLANVDPSEYSGLVAIGGAKGNDRIYIQRLFKDHGIITENIIHESAFIAKTARVGPGTQILAHALVASDVSIGEACILNHKAAVDHECVIGNGVHLAPGATLCGCVEIGENVFVGAASCILPRIKIGRNTIIGAGSLVITDIPEGVIAYGRPAKIIRKNQ